MLQRLQKSKSTQFDLPCLFDESNIVSIFGMLDPTGRGFISHKQYMEGMFCVVVQQTLRYLLFSLKKDLLGLFDSGTLYPKKFKGRRGEANFACFLTIVRSNDSRAYAHTRARAATHTHVYTHTCVHTHTETRAHAHQYWSFRHFIFCHPPTSFFKRGGGGGGGREGTYWVRGNASAVTATYTFFFFSA